MTVPKLMAENDAPATLRGRAVTLMSSVRAWASTEIGGWTIVIGLALCALTVAGAAVILPRLNAAPPRADAALTLTGQGGAQAVEDLADFTLSPEAVQDISQDAARLWNAALPFSTDPIRPSAPFFASPTDIESYGRALDCLTTAIYYEAASETPAGQAAVAQVVLNRSRHPAYPRTVCGVVFQGSERTTGCQFSFTCDGAMARTPSVAGWQRARAVAAAALNGHVATGVGTATHYHTDWVAPYWAPRLSKIVQIGTHIFYRWKGAWGLPSAFGGVYAGAEPVVPKMAALSTIAFETPVEVFDVSNTSLLEIEGPTASTGRLVPTLLPEIEKSEDVEAAETLATSTATAPPVIASRPVVVQRDVPIMADPMANPAAPPARQRQRIAAPSNW